MVQKRKVPPIHFLYKVVKSASAHSFSFWVEMSKLVLPIQKSNTTTRQARPGEVYQLTHVGEEKQCNLSNTALSSWLSPFYQPSQRELSAPNLPSSTDPSSWPSALLTPPTPLTATTMHPQRMAVPAVTWSSTFSPSAPAAQEETSPRSQWTQLPRQRPGVFLSHSLGFFSPTPGLGFFSPTAAVPSPQ